MNKAQLCAHMARHFAARRPAGVGGRPFRRSDAREFLEELERICRRELEAVDHFAITGIAKLVVETRGRRRGRSPVTGEPIVIPARRVVRARISSRLRKAIERSGPSD